MRASSAACERDVVEVVAAQARQGRPAARNLEASGAEQQCVQAADRVVIDGTFGSEAAQPLARIRVEQRRRHSRFGFEGRLSVGVHLVEKRSRSAAHVSTL